MKKSKIVNEFLHDGQRCLIVEYPASSDDIPTYICIVLKQDERGVIIGKQVWNAVSCRNMAHRIIEHMDK